MRKRVWVATGIVGLPLFVGSFASLVVKAYHGEAPVLTAIVLAMAAVGVALDIAHRLRKRSLTEQRADAIVSVWKRGQDRVELADGTVVERDGDTVRMTYPPRD